MVRGCFPCRQSSSKVITERFVERVGHGHLLHPAHLGTPLALQAPFRMWDQQVQLSRVLPSITSVPRPWAEGPSEVLVVVGSHQTTPRTFLLHLGLAGKKGRAHGGHR